LLPKVEFEVNEPLNKFCHISVLYSDLLPDELAKGMLGNKPYQAKHSNLRTDENLERLRHAGIISPTAWYSTARTLIRTKSLDEAIASLKPGRPIGQILNIMKQDVHGYDDIWASTKPRLEQYKQRFVEEWSPISSQVLSRLSLLTKEDWTTTNDILVNFVDCLNGGFAWTDSVAVYPFPDMDVEKKFLAHELSELMTPTSTVIRILADAGLDESISHTVVDMLAFFSVKDFLKNLDRKGIKPNPSYYPMANTLFPLLEGYSKDPGAYPNLESFLKGMVPLLEQYALP